MKDILTEYLESLGYSTYEQGSFTNEEDYPNSFFTIWNIDTQPLDHFDNEEDGYVWIFSINFYSIDPRLTNSVLLKAKTLLQEKGWIVPGKGKDVYSASKKHTGRGLEATFIEKN